MPLIPDIWRNVSDLSGQLDFDDWFGAERPVEIEIGCGKGLFLCTSSVARPEVNFVGVERDGTYLKRARAKVETRNLQNIRLIRGDMVYLLLNHIADHSVDAIHVYFPDPWPKRRHARRRMFSDISVEQFARCLKPGGLLINKTDVPVNAARIRRVVNDSQLFDLEDMRVWRAAEPPEGNIPTNFEIKYGPIGKEVFYARWRVKA